MAPKLLEKGKTHVLSSPLEHKAVLEPLEQLEARGFQVEMLPVDERGWVDPQLLAERLRPETGLVSLMHVNNEVGVVQPIGKYAGILEAHEAFFHVDAAQGFGKSFDPLKAHRIDLVSVSGHKIFAPKGVGALIARRRGNSRPPITPLIFGGGQERSIRPGTLPVPLVAGLGLAAELAANSHAAREASNHSQLGSLIDALGSVGGLVNGDRGRLLGNAVNISVPGLDSEAIMLAMKGAFAISNGSACTSHSYAPSHVLSAMALGEERIEGAIRVSWSHLTPAVNWQDFFARIEQLLPRSHATT